MAFAEKTLLMPILKVSEKVKKYALEVVRIPVSILGDCPQCRGNAYRDGICPDCSYIDPRVMQSIQEWQEAQGIQQKAAFRSLSFVDMLPYADDKKTLCPKSKSIEDHQKGNTVVDSVCSDPKCTYEAPPEGLGFKRPKFLGIDPRMIKNIRKNYLSPAAQKIEDNKKKLKKSAKGNLNPGALQDDSMNAKMDATTRMKDMLQQSALIDSQEKQQNDENAKSEELT
jgi:hypothetical protein